MEASMAETHKRANRHPIIKIAILLRSGVMDGPSGNVNLDTICRVMRKMHSIVTRVSLMDG